MKKYPYEMYCKQCDTVLAYIDHKPKKGDPIKVDGVIKIDGTFPKIGESIHECSDTAHPIFWVRKRNDSM